jgi:hypothetical protein
VPDAEILARMGLRPSDVIINDFHFSQGGVLTKLGAVSSTALDASFKSCPQGVIQVKTIKSLNSPVLLHLLLLNDASKLNVGVDVLFPVARHPTRRDFDGRTTPRANNFH